MKTPHYIKPEYRELVEKWITRLRAATGKAVNTMRDDSGNHCVWGHLLASQGVPFVAAYDKDGRYLKSAPIRATKDAWTGMRRMYDPYPKVLKAFICNLSGVTLLPADMGDTIRVKVNGNRNTILHFNDETSLTLPQIADIIEADLLKGKPLTGIQFKELCQSH